MRPAPVYVEHTKRKRKVENEQKQKPEPEKWRGDRGTKLRRSIEIENNKNFGELSAITRDNSSSDNSKNTQGIYIHLQYISIARSTIVRTL